MTLQDFAKPIPQALLNIEDKMRSNLLAWRGQFSPQLIESLLVSYCPPHSVVLDPFAGSGTVLCEAARMHLPAFGYEINPSAWSFSKLYEFANVRSGQRDKVISELRHRIDAEFPIVLFSEDELPPEVIEEKTIRIGESLSDRAKVLFSALIVILDLYKNRATSNLIHSKFTALAKLIHRVPYSDQQIKADLQDARDLPLEGQSIDFVITSPPYINVFNYHQNYRRSVEVLGWDLLRVARSEVGSNRANRGNRFYTVIQYCIDMATALQELARVLRPSGRAIIILGYESRVLGARLYNADIVERLACSSEMFDIVLRQQRVFTNRFGESIREDVLNLRKEASRHREHTTTALGRSVAMEALNSALATVPKSNAPLLIDAMSRINEITGTPVFNGRSHADYQTRQGVMMVKEARRRIHEQ